MGKSQETFNKKEKEKKRLKARQEKAEKMRERKANAKKGKSLEEMMAFIDENGNISDTPPDEQKKKKVKLEDIRISPPKLNGNRNESTRQGIVSSFNQAKGFGFISDFATRGRIFFHVNDLTVPVKEKDKVNFEVQSGPKGPYAVNITLS